MSTFVELTPNKTYATVENAKKAVEKRFPSNLFSVNELRYMIMTHTDGRFFPVFIGLNSMKYGVHMYFHIVA